VVFVLSRPDGDLILSLLEQVEPIIIGEVLEELSPTAGRVLLNMGALLPDGMACTTTVVCDRGVSFVDINWLSDRNARGYFDVADGMVAPEASSLHIFRLDFELVVRLAREHAYPDQRRTPS
jgi:hypothetical protein